MSNRMVLKPLSPLHIHYLAVEFRKERARGDLVSVSKLVRKRNRKDNDVLRALIDRLLTTKRPVWRRVAEELLKPRRKKTEVNLSKLETVAPEGSTVLVPGKVLGSGEVTKKINVAAFAFSRSAKEIIEASGGKAMTISELLDSNPEGKGIVLIK